MTSSPLPRPATPPPRPHPCPPPAPPHRRRPAIALPLGVPEVPGGGRVLGARKRAVLRPSAEDYVSTHEPVGSRSLVDRHRLDVSPATIRNDMAVLEEQGFIVQPHTSAGRVPTDKGYRLFVDRPAGGQPLSSAERPGVETVLAGGYDPDDGGMRTGPLPPPPAR